MPMPDFLTITTTNRCDLKCAHCVRGFPKERFDIPLEVVEPLLREARSYGSRHVSLSGGEPHLHPEFEKIVEIIVQYGYSWHFGSNGQRTEPYLPLIELYKENFHYVSLSIDGATEEINDSIRGKGTFKKVMCSAKEYISKGHSLRIGTSLNQKNKHQLEDFIKLAVELGANQIGFSGTIPTPWNEDLQLDDEECQELYEEIIKLREAYSISIGILSALYTRGGIHFCDNLHLRELDINACG